MSQKVIFRARVLALRVTSVVYSVNEHCQHTFTNAENIEYNVCTNPFPENLLNFGNAGEDKRAEEQTGRFTFYSSTLLCKQQLKHMLTDTES